MKLVTSVMHAGEVFMRYELNTIFLICVIFSHSTKVVKIVLSVQAAFSRK